VRFSESVLDGSISSHGWMSILGGLPIMMGHHARSKSAVLLFPSGRSDSWEPSTAAHWQTRQFRVRAATTERELPWDGSTLDRSRVAAAYCSDRLSHSPETGLPCLGRYSKIQHFCIKPNRI